MRSTLCISCTDETNPSHSGHAATANTISRLLAGLLSDLLSPSRPLPASTSNTDDVADPNHRPGHKASGSLRSTLSRIRVSRLTIILATMIGLLVAFLYAAFGLRDTDGLVLVSLLTGIGGYLSFLPISFALSDTPLFVPQATASSSPSFPQSSRNPSVSPSLVAHGVSFRTHVQQGH